MSESVSELPEMSLLIQPLLPFPCRFEFHSWGIVWFSVTLSSTISDRNDSKQRLNMSCAPSFSKEKFFLPRRKTLVLGVVDYMDASHLVNSVVTYFRQKGYKTEQDTIWDGKASGLSHRFDLIIRKGSEQRLVWIRAWRRTVGVNMVINMDKAAEDVGMPSPIMISEKFSGHAKAYANRRGVTLLTKTDIIQRLG